jgi:N-acetylglucosaminyldiphosphoundecaprenol N-acetyl-beta-D-mannosaminyltransferase
VSAAAPISVDRPSVMGCEIDRVDVHEAVERCAGFIERRQLAQHMAINAAKLVAIHDDTALREIVKRCELVTADGQAVVWASRLLGDPLPQRVAGIDLMLELLALAEQRGFSVYILGARREVLDEAVRRILARHPGLRVAGYRDGYFSPSEDGDVAAEISRARPDILFVAISSPRKEYFLGTYGRRLGVPLIMGVGGAIDVAAGVTKRAPARVQRAGLEWLYRTAQEPRRLTRRYLVTNARFAVLLARELFDRFVLRRGDAGRSG